MTWQDILLLVLAVVDTAALTVGLKILKKVTRIVKETGDTIKETLNKDMEVARQEVSRSFQNTLNETLTSLLPTVQKILEDRL